MTRKVAQTQMSRLFVALGGACQGNYQYGDCVRMDGLSQTLGDSEPIYCPSRLQMGQFEQDDSVVAEDSDWTTSLVGRMSLDTESLLWQVQRLRCGFDVHLNFGRCTDPTDIDSFELGFVIEGARITDYSTDQLGALEPGDRSPINETVSLSATTVYQKRRQTWGESGAALANTFDEVISVAFQPGTNCDADCGSVNTGCQIIYALARDTATGDMTILYTRNGGTSWSSYTNASLVADAGVVYKTFRMFATRTKLYILAGQTTPATEVFIVDLSSTNSAPTSVTSLGEFGTNLMDGASRTEDGFIYFNVTGADELYKLDMSQKTVSGPIAAPGSAGALYVAFLDEDFGVAADYTQLVQNSISYTVNGGASWTSVSPDVTGSTPTGQPESIWVLSETCWFFGTSDGEIVVTRDGGQTITKIADLADDVGGIIDEDVWQIVFATNNIGYAYIENYVWRTYNGGVSWQVQPDGGGTSLPLGIINHIAACSADPNVAIVAGKDPTELFGVIAIGYPV